MDSPAKPILSEINTIPLTDINFFKIHSIISSHLRLVLPRGLFLVGLHIKFIRKELNKLKFTFQI